MSRAPVFRLDRVLRHREDEEQSRERELAIALSDLDAQSRILDSACQRHEAALGRMRGALATGRVSAPVLAATQTSLEYSLLGIRRAEEVQSHRSEIAAMRRDELIIARQAREVITRLRDRKIARQAQIDAVREQVELDELAGVTHHRAKSSATPRGSAYTPSTQTLKDVLM